MEIKYRYYQPLIYAFSPQNKAIEIRYCNGVSLKDPCNCLNGCGETRIAWVGMQVCLWALAPSWLLSKPIPGETQMLKVSRAPYGMSASTECAGDIWRANILLSLCKILTSNSEIVVYNRKPNNMVGGISFQPQKRTLQREQMARSLQ